MKYEEARDLVIEERGVREKCPKCYGLGTYAYGSTSTWHGGVGGSTITIGVCDNCWGSGDAHKKWPSHRLLESKAAIAQR